MAKRNNQSAHKMASGEASLAPLTSMYTNWFSCMGKLNHELVHFMNDRLRQDFELPSRFAECQNPTELLDMQLEFMQKMATDYTGEAQKIYKVVADAAKTPN